MSDDYERLLETALREFRLEVEQQVELEFEARRKLPDKVANLPWIDGTYDPHAPPEEHAELKQRVIRALCARRRFQDEAGAWAPPLPLCEKERVALLNTGDRRLSVVAGYGMRLQGGGWHYQRAGTFFDFIQQCA